MSEFWKAALEGRSGITVIEEEWAEGLPVRIAGRLRVEPAEVLGRVKARRLDRCQRLEAARGQRLAEGGVKVGMLHA